MQPERYNKGNTARAMRPGRYGQGDAARVMRPGRCGQGGEARSARTVGLGRARLLRPDTEGTERDAKGTERCHRMILPFHPKLDPVSLTPRYSRFL